MISIPLNMSPLPVDGTLARPASGLNRPANTRTSDMLANLALNYLASSLLRRDVVREDVVAVLNMALWNQRRNAAMGPSSWPLVGHGQRLARRIGLQDEVPYSEAWLVIVSLDVYDHL